MDEQRQDAPGTDGPPPPPWQREHERRERRIVLVVAVAAVVLGVPVGLAAWNLASEAGSIDLSGPTAAEDGGDDPDGGGDGGTPDEGEARPEVEVPELDLDELSGEDEAVGRVLVDVDRAERTMIEAQERISAAFTAADPQDPDGDAVAAEISDAAGVGQRGLQDIRSDLAAPVDAGVARDLRDHYLTHLDAWVRYLVAVEETPGILASEDGDDAMLLAIDTTGEDFARVVREDLPDDLEPQVRELADAIVERGFPERELSDDDTV